jgi:EAL domain-containing protein (putative c-di-GMP-specific phosphodiesterase class I)
MNGGSRAIRICRNENNIPGLRPPFPSEIDSAYPSWFSRLKELGCKFALDDFGTGLSSFGYLKHYPVDFLKIDGSFVTVVLHDPIDREMVRSINEIGHLTGKQTIAEWAENAEIIEVLRGLGVDYAQGYGVTQPQKVQRAAIA